MKFTGRIDDYDFCLAIVIWSFALLVLYSFYNLAEQFLCANYMLIGGIGILNKQVLYPIKKSKWLKYKAE